MSMTPLQAIAATKFVNGEGLSAHRMQKVADAYALHPLVALIRDNPSIQANVDNDFPPASAGIRAADAAFFATFGGSTNVEDGLVDYANHVLCNGDIGKFSSVVDKCSGLIVAVGDVTAAIDKASSMKFEDLGPGVKNFADSLSSGLGSITEKLKEAMQKANNGQLPQVQGVPQTDTAVVGTVILAQGEVSGDSASPNFGTALGIYYAAKSKGMTESIDAIHQEFLKQRVTVVGKIKGTSGDYIRVAPVTNFTEAQFNEMMDLTYEAAVENDTSDNEVKRAESVTIKAWVESRRAKGYDSFMSMIHSIALKIMNEPDKYSVDVLLKITADLTVRSETHMKEAIDALPLEQAKKLFQGLGSKIEVEKLEKFTDILDVTKCAAAMPEPLTTRSAPVSVTSNTEVETSPATPPADATPKVEGSLEKARESQTAYQEAAKLKSNQADIAAGKPPSEWNVTPEQVVSNRSISKSGPAAISGLGGLFSGSAFTSLPTSLPTSVGTTSTASTTSITTSMTGAEVAAKFQSDLDKAADTPYGKSALGQKALSLASSMKVSLAPTVDSLRGAAVDLGSQPKPQNLEQAQAAALGSMSKLGADFGQIKGFGNVPDMKSLGGMMRSMETSLPVSRGIPGLSSLTQPVTVTDADIEEARKLSSNAADVAAGKPPSEWNVTPEQFVRNTKMNKALTPTFLNNLKDVMPAEIKTELQAAVGTGSGAGGKYSLIDFVGSAVGENGQVENWTTIINSLDSLWATYQSDLEFEIDAASGSYSAGVSGIISNMANSIEGIAATTAYEDSIAKVKAEYTLLTTKAGVNFATIPAGDLTNTLNLAKKIAQHASKLDSGHAAIFQNAADPDSMGGQALLGVMVEARNNKLMSKVGLQPGSMLTDANQAQPTDQDRAEAAKIQAKSGDPDAITAEQVARNRALNNTLKGLFGV